MSFLNFSLNIVQKNINVVKLIKWIVYSNTKNNLNKTATTWDIHTYIASPHNHQTTTSPPPATLFLAGFAGFRPKLLLSQISATPIGGEFQGKLWHCSQSVQSECLGLGFVHILFFYGKSKASIYIHFSPINVAYFKWSFFFKNG